MAVDLPRKGQHIQYLEAYHAAKLLEFADADLTPGLGLMLFVRVRAEELFREAQLEGEDVLRWEDVNLETKTITVRAKVAKTRVARSIRNAPANLWDWLTP